LRYGLVVAYTSNLGDDIQSLAALQFYPRVDVLLHREYLNMVQSDDKIKVVINGWFMHRPENWPPAPVIKPLFISMHIDPRAAKEMLKQNLNYFKLFEPIGARDLFTKRLLEKHNIQSYFSGCLSLTLDYKFNRLKFVKTDSSDYIVAVDVPTPIMDILYKIQSPKMKVVAFSHKLFDLNYIDRLVLKVLWLGAKLSNILEYVRREYLSLRLYQKGFKYSIIERFRAVLNELVLIANARCVITKRLHVALPSITFGIPTVFIVLNARDPRLSGYSKYIKFFQIDELLRLLTKKSIDGICNECMEYQSDNRSELLKLKTSLIKTVESFLHKAS